MAPAGLIRADLPKETLVRAFGHTLASHGSLWRGNALRENFSPNFIFDPRDLGRVVGALESCVRDDTIFPGRVVL
jgi:hypothetical protein